MDQAKNIPDDLMIKILELHVMGDLESTPSSSVILDGFPRTVNQAKMFDKMLDDADLSIFSIFWLQISDEEAIRRVERRRICLNCGAAKIFDMAVCDDCGGNVRRRKDDDKIKDRLKEFHSQTMPVLAHYLEGDTRVFITGEESVDHINTMAKNCIKNVMVEKIRNACDDENMNNILPVAWLFA